MAFVIDNSVVCGWFIGNQATDYTEAVAACLLDEQARPKMGSDTISSAAVLIRTIIGPAGAQPVRS